MKISQWLLICISFLTCGLAEDILLPGELWSSGYESVEQTPGDDLFYFLLKSKDGNKSAPLIVYINGGPGCATSLNLFVELGPYTVNRTTHGFSFNKFSWNTFADILFVDQPVGIGYSKYINESRRCTNVSCVASDFMVFLVKFFSGHPEYIGRPLYVGGVSYGGHYVPAVTAKIARTHHPWFNLKGMALGNPWIQDDLQQGASPYYLFENEVFSWIEYFIARVTILACQVAHIYNYNIRFLFDICNDDSLGGMVKLPNIYDIRDPKDYSDIFEAVETLMNNKTIQKLVGVDVPNYMACDNVSMELFYKDQISPTTQYIEYLLENNYDVIWYFGDKDYSCNWRGGEAVANSMKWKGAEEYSKKEFVDWKVNGNVIGGKYKKVKNFNFLLIYDAGHIVPLNKPEVALEMIKRFIYKQF